MAKIKQDFTGDAGQLTKELQKIAADYAKLEKQLKEALVQSQRAAAATKQHTAALKESTVAAEEHGDVLAESLQDGINDLKGLATGWLGVQAVLSTINQLMEDQKKVGEDVLAVHDRIAAAQAKGRQATPNLTGAQHAAMEATANRINIDAAVGDLPAVMEAMKTAYSATNDLRSAEEITRILAPIFRHNPEELAQTATEVGAGAVALGGQDASRRSAALVFSALDVSNRDLVNYKHLQQGAVGVLANDRTGNTEQALRDGLAFQTAFTMATNASNENAKTALMDLDRVLAKMLPQEESLDARIRRVRGDPRLQRKFMAQEGLGQAAGALRLFLGQADTPMWRQYESNRQNISTDGQILDRLAGEMSEGSPQLRVATLQRRWEAKRQAKDLTLDLTAEKTRINQEVMRGLLETRHGRTGGLLTYGIEWNWQRQILAAEDQASAYAIGAAALEDRARAYRDPGYTTKSGVSRTAEMDKQVAAIEETAREMRAAAEALRESAKANADRGAAGATAEVGRDNKGSP